MAVNFDIAAKDLRSYDKGDIVSISPEGMDCSDDPENYICLTIEGITHAQGQHYIEGWEIDFQHVIIKNNPAGWRVEISVDPAYINASDVGRDEMKTDMQALMDDEYWEGCSIYSFSSSAMTVNIPKNGPYQTSAGLTNQEYLALLKSNFSDVFKTTLKIRRYHFSESDVDDVINNYDGHITLSAAQALSVVLDRLQEAGASLMTILDKAK